jgi:hypothetical protein
MFNTLKNTSGYSSSNHRTLPIDEINSKSKSKLGVCLKLAMNHSHKTDKDLKLSKNKVKFDQLVNIIMNDKNCQELGKKLAETYKGMLHIYDYRGLLTKETKIKSAGETLTDFQKYIFKKYDTDHCGVVVSGGYHAYVHKAPDEIYTRILGVLGAKNSDLAASLDSIYFDIYKSTSDTIDVLKLQTARNFLKDLNGNDNEKRIYKSLFEECLYSVKTLFTFKNYNLINNWKYQSILSKSICASAILQQFKRNYIKNEPVCAIMNDNVKSHLDGFLHAAINAKIDVIYLHLYDQYTELDTSKENITKYIKLENGTYEKSNNVSLDNLEQDGKDTIQKLKINRARSQMDSTIQQSIQ